MSEFISPREAAALINDKASVGICGFGGWLGADLIFKAMRERFDSCGSPSGLTVLSGILPGDLTEEPRGMNLLAEEGLISTVMAAHVGMAPLFGKMIAANRLAAFALPLGLVGDLLRAAAGKKPGVLTSVGLGTFCDPRVEGCALNEPALRSGYSPSELTVVDGREYLLYRTVKLDACILRAYAADENGSITAERDPLVAEQLDMALAVKAAGGTVIVQADRLLPDGAIHAKDLLMHHSLVDYVVVDEDGRCAPGYDCPSFRPELCGDVKILLSELAAAPLSQRKICGRRGALELRPGYIVNLGIGVPESVAAVAGEEGISDKLTLSVESGPLGGVPVGGVGFGASVNPEIIYRLTDNFAFYDGGGLDMAFLGAAEIDAEGNVNVSKFGPRTTGPGGFINIAQNAGTVCFMGTFTASGLKTSVQDGKLRIDAEGSARKFRKTVQQITFSAKYAAEHGQRVLYITERAVFALTKKGVTLIEIAPGIDLERDILGQMDFLPQVAADLRVMDARIFAEEPMGLFAE